MNTSAAANPDGRNTRWDQHRRERRDELIKAARAAVHDLGPAASMDDIASHAGTSKSVFYRYFGDKNGLQRAVGEKAIEFVGFELQRAAKGAENPVEALQTMITNYLELADSSPNVYNFSTESAGEVAEFFTGITDVMASIHERFQATVPQSTSTVAHKISETYWPSAAIGFVRHAGEFWLMEPLHEHRPTASQLARQLTRWLVQGLTNPVPTTPSAQVRNA